jgi:4-hydroxy-3-methylbut-2-enyl diphosphate reductase
MALVSQSTQPPWKFQKLAAFMVNRAHELRIVNTVCPVTIRRQEDTVALTREVDFMVVVGGRNSANTRELTRLVTLEGRPVVQIERATELTDAGIFSGHRVVGITGGTSTPIEDLETVAARVLELAGTDDVRAQAPALAAAAIAEVADPAYRSTSIGRADRRPVPASRRSPVAAAHA